MNNIPVKGLIYIFNILYLYVFRPIEFTNKLLIRTSGSSCIVVQRGSNASLIDIWTQTQTPVCEGKLWCGDGGVGAGARVWWSLWQEIKGSSRPAALDHVVSLYPLPYFFFLHHPYIIQRFNFPFFDEPHNRFAFLFEIVLCLWIE